MAQQIHCRQRRGRLVYRCWSTETNTYTTEELSAEELHDLLQKKAVAAFEQSFIKTLVSVRERGTSYMLDGRIPLTAPWNEELSDDEDGDEYRNCPSDCERAIGNCESCPMRPSINS